jgi:hypothetical protein
MQRDLRGYANKIRKEILWDMQKHLNGTRKIEKYVLFPDKQ